MIKYKHPPVTKTQRFQKSAAVAITFRNVVLSQILMAQNDYDTFDHIEKQTKHTIKKPYGWICNDGDNKEHLSEIIEELCSHIKDAFGLDNGTLETAYQAKMKRVDDKLLMAQEAIEMAMDIVKDQ